MKYIIFFGTMFLLIVAILNLYKYENTPHWKYRCGNEPAIGIKKCDSLDSMVGIVPIMDTMIVANSNHCMDTIPPEYRILFCKETNKYVVEYVFNSLNTPLLAYCDPRDEDLKDYVMLAYNKRGSQFDDSCAAKLLIFRHWQQVLQDRGFNAKHPKWGNPVVDEKCFKPISTKRK